MKNQASGVKHDHFGVGLMDDTSRTNVEEISASGIIEYQDFIEFQKID